ncbi:MAG: hypothetical protein ACR2GY_00735 [Phycisphaerales bacterium]
MIRAIWNGIMILAVVNLLAAGAFIGWLWQSGRLNQDRVHAIRDLLEPTIAETEQLALDAKQTAEQAEIVRLEAVRDANPMPPSATRVHLVERIKQSDEDRIRRAREEMADLQAQLISARGLLAAERKAFEAERNAYRAGTETTAEAFAKAQFARVVTLLEQIPARQAKDMLVALMQQQQTDDAVAYLNAMKPFSAAEVVKSFKGQEQALATELLQRMKALNPSSAVAEGANDAVPANTDDG